MEIDMVYLVEETFEDHPNCNTKQLMDADELSLSYPAVWPAVLALQIAGFDRFIIDVTQDLFTLKIFGEPNADTETFQI